MTPRTVPEWIGKDANSPAPPRVRLRVFEAHGGICHISGRKIRPGEPWDLDHVTALCNWTGEGHGNRESNLQVLCKWCHKGKTAGDVAEKSRAYRVKAKLYGKAKAKGRPLPGTKASGWKKRMDGTVERRDE